MKNSMKIYKKVGLFTALLALTGCNLFDIGGSSNNSSSSYSFVAPNIDVNEPAITRPSSYVYDNQELGRSSEAVYLSSLGDQKILVVPIVFTDSSSQALATSSYKKAIQNTFFGKSSDTGWESVASFYEKSSYGKLNLSGEVTDYFHLGMSVSELENKAIDDYSYWDQTHYVLEAVYDHYSTVNNGALLKEYDQDGDGYVDAVWLVYMASINQRSDVFWAYQYFWNHYPNLAIPTFNAYAWASYQFMNDGGGYNYNNVDAHTFIHETGHLLSLEDYYDYDGKTAPAGGIDMMDYNIVDHNMFSKYILNWNQPLVVKDTTQIKLDPAQKNGDFILLNLNWNGHAYDEYIVIEYYTPTGLNQKDSSGNGYDGVVGFSQNGIKMYHIDARLVSITNGRSTYTDEIITNTRTYTQVGASNTPADSVNKNFKLIHLLNAVNDTKDWYTNGNKVATNSALFKTGHTIEANNWQTYLRNASTFNDGSKVGFKVQIGELTAENATIYITKV